MISRKIEYLIGRLKMSFSKDVFTVLTGTILAQAIPFLIAPILTRLYTPAEFGIFGTYTSILMILAVFVTGRYEMAVILPPSKSSSASVIKLSLFIATIICSVLFIIILFFKHSIALALNAPRIENALLLLPLSTFLIGSYQCFSFWSNKLGSYKDLSISRVLRSTNYAILSFLFAGVNFLAKMGLILADIIGQLSANIFLVYKSLKNNKQYFSTFNWNEIKVTAKEYVNFPKYNLSAGILEKGAGQIPLILFSSFFGSTVVGYLALTQRAISAPASIIAQAIGDIFRQKANEKYIESGHCKELFNATFKNLIVIAIIPFSIIIAFAPKLFSLLFGSAWAISGHYMQILGLMYFLQFIVSPLSNMFLIAQKQKYDLYIQFFLFVFIVTGVMFGYNLIKKPEPVITIYAIVYSIKYIVELILSYKFSRGNNI